MPYLINYEQILKKSKADYDIIIWDRFGIEKRSAFVYRDRKYGHRRGLLDYYRYQKFINKHLDSAVYDKLIVFGVPLSLFIRNTLLSKFKNNYILDIRDYHRIINYWSISEIVSKSSFTVISSPNFTRWLPCSDKYIINHNTIIGSMKEIKNVNLPHDKSKINVCCMGIIRDYQINIDLIDSLKNHACIDVYYHGEGDINDDILEHLKRANINNVYLTGRYENEDEADLYINSDLVNVLISNRSINNKTLLPNRLYNAAVYGKPIIAYEGTYLADQIKKYNLGIVIDSFVDVGKKVMEYLKNFEVAKYERGRRAFFDTVIKKNKHFKLLVEKFTS